MTISLIEIHSIIDSQGDKGFLCFLNVSLVVLVKFLSEDIKNEM